MLTWAKDVVKGGFCAQDGVMYCNDKPSLGVERIYRQLNRVRLGKGTAIGLVAKASFPCYCAGA